MLASSVPESSSDVQQSVGSLLTTTSKATSSRSPWAVDMSGCAAKRPEGSHPPGRRPSTRFPRCDSVWEAQTAAPREDAENPLI